MKKISSHRFFELVWETTLAYVIFILAFYSIPLVQKAWASVSLRANTEITHAIIAETKIVIEIVRDHDDRILGLSGRQELPPNHGMLFDFEKQGRHGIWMKNMLFSIDIVWISNNMEVVYIVEDVSPRTFPTIFSPRSDATYVLELPSGFVKKNGIKRGDLLTIL